MQALMTAPWPKSLFHHPLMTPCTLTGLSGDALSVVSTQIPAMFFAGYPGELCTDAILILLQ